MTLKLGRFSASDDFNASPFYGYSLNNGPVASWQNDTEGKFSW